MIRRIWFWISGCLMVSICLMLLPALAASASEGGQLLRNEGFEQVEAQMASGWAFDAYKQDASVSVGTIESDYARSGNHYLRIQNKQPNDARWVQSFEVKPDTLYRLSVWVRAQVDGQDGGGANISVLQSSSMSKAVTRTDGSWEQVQLIGRTGKEQTEAAVALRLGSYGQEVTGVADFDDAAVEEITDQEAGAAEVQSLAPSGGSGLSQNSLPVAASGSSWLTGFMLLYGLLFALVCVPALAPQSKFLRLRRIQKENAPHAWFPALLVAAFIVKVIGAACVKGHPIDILDFGAWAGHAFADGLPQFYNDAMFVDYPPGYVYVLYVIGLLGQMFMLGGDSPGSLALLKLPAILADLGTAWLIYRYARQWVQSDARALLLAALYLFNPAVYVNSALWGQIDSVFAFVIVLSLTAFTSKRPHWGSALMTAAFLIKPQAAVFVPLILFEWIRLRSLPTVVRSLAASVAVFLIGAFPFLLHKKPLWIVEHYKEMFASYPYASLNAANLFAWLGFNGAQLTEKWLLLPLGAWGTIFVALIVALLVYLAMFKNKAYDAGHVFYWAFLLSLLVFVFKTGMHERYAYPALALSLISYIRLKDMRILALFCALSLLEFINVAYVLDWALQEQYYLPAQNTLLRFLGFGHTAAAAYSVYVAWTLGKVRQSKEKEPLKNRSKGHKPSKPIRPLPQTALGALRLTRKDWIIMSVSTVLYTIVALVNLGSFHAPQTSYKPADKGSFYVDLGGRHAVHSMLLYTGIGDGMLRVERSDDGQSWEPLSDVQLNYATVFQWKQAAGPFEAQFVKISVEQPGASVYEVAFLDEQSAVLPIASMQPLTMSTGDLEHLRNWFDEPEQTPRKPSFMNGMYFDEIYHGRTAYEFIHHIEPFETTHPPLGKVLISWGISLFGMNPFGWRIMGALAGAAMVPLMYVLGRWMFGATRYGVMAALLMAFDFMHFTQSRIATVDVFGVLFIILMYVFMYGFYASSAKELALRKSLIYLGLSGLAFGIGAACKWIDIYAGGGLAVILAVALFQRRPGSRQVWRILLWCVPFFVLVPVIIYSLSYIPFFLVEGQGHGLKDVLSYQQFMFAYHSQLEAVHPFSSKWWEWPLMVKPVWYYGDALLPADLMSSIVAFGNPAVWWGGIPAVAGCVYLYVKKRENQTLLFILIGLAAQFVPWIGVSRLTFIYHFFASVPFLVLCITAIFWYAMERKDLAKDWLIAFIAFAALLFLMFYPALSGVEVSKSYVDHILQWKSTWIFHS